MTKKKIFIVSQSASSFDTIFKGIPKYLSDHYSVYLIGPRYTDHVKLEKRENVKYIFVNVKRKITILSDLIFLFQSIYFILKFKPHIIHSFFPKPVLIMAIAAYICRVNQRIITFTGLVFPSRNGLIRRLLLSFDKLSCLLSTKILAEGLDVKNEMLSFKLTSKKIEVIGNGNISGVDLDFFNPTRNYSKDDNKFTSQLLYNGKKNLLYVGRLSNEKGINELLEAYEFIKEKFNLLLVGECECSKIEKKLSQKKENNLDIYYFKHKLDVRPFYSLADVFILPSYREGFSNVLLEAGSMSLPALVTDVNGSREIIDDNVNGWIVPIRDVLSIQNKLKVISMMDKKSLIKMGNNLRNKVSKLYSHKEQKENILKFYNSL